MVPQSLIRSASRAHARSAVRSSAQEEAKDDEGAGVPSSQIVQRSPRANLRQSLDNASSTSGDQPGVQRVEAAETEDAGVVQPAQSRISSEDRAMFDKIASQHGFKEAIYGILTGSGRGSRANDFNLALCASRHITRTGCKY